MLTNSTQ